MRRNSYFQIRPAQVEDRDVILSVVPRLVEFGAPPWRDSKSMITTDLHVVTEKFTNRPSDTAVFIAEDQNRIPLGFIHLQTGADYYYHEKHRHAANLIVAPEGEGRGIGRMLLEKAEEWARAQGFRWLTLSVFAQNARAITVYEQFGFGEDIMNYVKELR